MTLEENAVSGCSSSVSRPEGDGHEAQPCCSISDRMSARFRRRARCFGAGAFGRFIRMPELFLHFVRLHERKNHASEKLFKAHAGERLKMTRAYPHRPNRPAAQSKAAGQNGAAQESLPAAATSTQSVPFRCRR